MVEGAAVQAEVIDQIKGDKVIHFVKRRRKHSSKRTKGHRQQLTLLKITEILEKGGDKSGVKAAVGAGSVAGGETGSTRRGGTRAAGTSVGSGVSPGRGAHHRPSVARNQPSGGGQGYVSPFHAT